MFLVIVNEFKQTFSDNTLIRQVRSSFIPIDYFMFDLVKSKIVISIFFFFFLLLPNAYCQEKNEQFENPSQNFSGKPKTIVLKPDKRIKSVYASDNENKLFISEVGGILYSFDGDTFEQLWMTDFGGRFVSEIAESKDLIYFVTSKSDTNSIGVLDNNSVSDTENGAVDNSDISNRNDVSELWAVDKKSGITINKIYISGERDFYLFPDKNYLYIVSDLFVSVYNFDLSRSVSKYPISENLSAKPLFDVKTGLFLFLYKDKVLRVSLNKDKFEESKFVLKPKKTKAFNSIVLTDKFYIVGDSIGNLYAINNIDGNIIWKFRAGGKLTDIKIFGDRIIVSSNDNFIYCMDISSGKRIWKKRLSGRISSVIKLTEEDFFIKSLYSTEFYLVDVHTGIITEKYINARLENEQEENHFDFQIKSSKRLIIIQNNNSIDIYKKNQHNLNTER